MATSPSTLNDSKAPGRAVVLGASLAGLLAARVLSDNFTDVLLLERDELPAGAAPRKGTPQAVHPHGLLARGREVLETLFPALRAQMPPDHEPARTLEPPRTGAPPARRHGRRAMTRLPRPPAAGVGPSRPGHLLHGPHAACDAGGCERL
jgi:phytoene dehydrogenase-like protein